MTLEVLDLAAEDWPYTLGLMFLAAAQSCGFECGRTFVIDGCQPEGMPPGCPCQLAVQVEPGYQPAREAPGVCVPRRMASVTLYLDLCVVTPGQDAVPDPDTVTANAHTNLTALWQIMRGLQRARATGDLGLSCAQIIPNGWGCMMQQGGMARWQTTWTFIE